MPSARASRADRLTSNHSGAWSTASQDYIFLATQLFAHSTSEANAKNRYASAYVFAGVPILFAALRALLIECNSGIYRSARDGQALSRLASDPSELGILRDKYGVADDSLENLRLLYEVRNEIVHPAHRAAGTPDNTPSYFQPLKSLDVLVTTGDPHNDYTWNFQLQSHRLFRFAFETTESLARQVLEVEAKRDPAFHCGNLESYGRFRTLQPPH